MCSTDLDVMRTSENQHSVTHADEIDQTLNPVTKQRSNFWWRKKKRNRCFLCCCMFVFDVGDRFSSSIAERRWWSVWIQANKMPTDGGEEIGDEDYNTIIVYVIKQLAHTDLHSIIRSLHLFPSLFLTTLFSFIFFYNFFPWLIPYWYLLSLAMSGTRTSTGKEKASSRKALNSKNNFKKRNNSVLFNSSLIFLNKWYLFRP